MRYRGIAVFLIAAGASVTACTASDGAAGVISPASNTGQLVIDVRVNGDPASSSRGFIVRVNDDYAAPAVLNGTQQITRASGDYRISIESEYDILNEPSWCFVPQGNVSIVHVGRDSTTTLRLEVECPSLTGNARIRIHGVATGPHAPAEVNYLVGRIHPRQSWPTSSVRITVGGVQEMNGEPGIYMILANEQSGRCNPTIGNFFGPYALDPSGYAVVRDGQVVDVNSGLSCP